MNLLERATIVHYHRHRIAQHGGNAVEALGWRNADSQRLRFEAIARAADFNGASVMDLGCGCGDLKPFLDRHFQGFAYLGIDQMPEFIATAQARHGHLPRTLFHLGDFCHMALPLVDHVVACGALGYRSEDPHHHLHMIQRMHAAARHTVIFNCLDAAHFPEHPLLVGRNRDEVLAFCESLAPEVELVAGYREDDFTVVMRLDPQAAPSFAGPARVDGAVPAARPTVCKEMP